MSVVTIVFAIIFAILSGSYAGYLSLKRGEKEFGISTIVGTLICIGILFGSTVVAAEAAWWSYLVGGVLALILGGLLTYRLWSEYAARKKLVAQLSEPCPTAPWRRAETFHQTLTVYCGLMAFIFVDCRGPI
jgi:Na+-translocating ferredoxin:NAD+ oxidoreductase RnfD subunit